MYLCIFSASMRYAPYFLLLSLSILLSMCQRTQEQATQVVNNSEFNIEQKHPQIEILKKSVSKKVDDWQEYNSVKDFLNQYKSISPNEALNNSKELNDLVKMLKDSIKPDFLTLKSLDARVNLLHNETLRLFDMSAISSIKSTEVNEQVTKIIEAFSALNSKVNIIAKQADLEAQVNDPNFKRVQEKDTSLIENAKPLKPAPFTGNDSDRNQRILQQQRAQQKRFQQGKTKKKIIPKKTLEKKTTSKLSNVKKKKKQ